MDDYARFHWCIIDSIYTNIIVSVVGRCLSCGAITQAEVSSVIGLSGVTAHR